MTTVVALSDIKRNLRLSESVTNEDAHLERLLAAALRVVEHETGRTIRGDAPTLVSEDLNVANLAILLLISTWYVSRDLEGSVSPRALWILEPLRRFDNGDPA